MIISVRSCRCYAHLVGSDSEFNFDDGVNYGEMVSEVFIQRTNKTNYIRVLKIVRPLTRLNYILSGALMPSISSPSLRTVLIASHNARRALLRAISSVTILHLL